MMAGVRYIKKSNSTTEIFQIHCARQQRPSGSEKRFYFMMASELDLKGTFKSSMSHKVMWEKENHKVYFMLLLSIECYIIESFQSFSLILL